QVAPLAKTNVDIVGEVQGPRRARANTAALETGLGENQHLRRLGDAKFLKEGAQIAESRLVGGVDLSGVPPPPEARNGVGRRGFAIANGLSFKLDGRGRRRLAGRQQDGA